MRRYHLLLPPSIEEAIRSFPPELKKDVRNALDLIRIDPSRGTPLRDELEDRWRYRVRRHRIVYRIDSETRTVRVVAIAPRESVYEELTGKRRVATDSPHPPALAGGPAR